jgi:hypothetical protein
MDEESKFADFIRDPVEREKLRIATNAQEGLRNVGNEDSHWGYQLIGMRYNLEEKKSG